MIRTFWWASLVLLFGMPTTWNASKTIATAETPAHAARSHAEPTGESENFFASSYPGGPQACDVLRWCESTRNELVRAWCVPGGLAAWNPKCEIALHPSRASYLNAVGSWGVQSQGSSRIQRQGGQVISRRIDLLAGSSGELPALPHELTHLILADRFCRKPPPLWFDEAAAMFADTPEKQTLHERDCLVSLKMGSYLPMRVLLDLEQFSSAAQLPPFYGQSLSLLHFLCRYGDLQKATLFTLDAQSRGYDEALRNHYGIDGVLDLERQWKSFAYNHSGPAQTTSQVAVTFVPPTQK